MSEPVEQQNEQSTGERGSQGEASPEARQDAPGDVVGTPPTDAVGADTAPAEEAAATSGRAARATTRPRTRTRAAKQDAVLTAAVDLARDAVVAGAHDARGIGEHLGVRVQEDRLLTHLFDCTLPGYPGWTWYATVARAPRSKHVTVCESGLLSGPGSLLAPPWVPWEERMQAINEQDGQDDDAARPAESGTGGSNGDARGGSAETGASAEAASGASGTDGDRTETSEDGASS
ncbi:DUF3027 domain-containing protein [Kocuria rhizophila]|uniref:DUF3027 domain-containing protein n=1 Tax=Kocuria rhizophila TaxID=72000 RepID=UPI00119F17C9|nr:DUF3027 domain-containing protein [Kocuria rhizophila]